MRRKVKKLLRKHGYPPDKQKDAVVTVIEQAELVCRDWSQAPPPVVHAGATQSTSPQASAKVVPFRRLSAEDVPYENAIPLYALAAAAGVFGGVQAAAEPQDWVLYEGRRTPAEGLFVAQVVGESMNRRIPNGAWCVWKANPGGTRQGKVVLAQLRDDTDPETGGRFTVKVYASEKVVDGEGGVRNEVVRLKPDSTDVRFEALEFRGLDAMELRVVAELVEVLG